MNIIEIPLDLQAEIKEKTRVCYACHSNLKFLDFVLMCMNPKDEILTLETEKKAKTLWLDSRVEILCCSCFDYNNKLLKQGIPAGIALKLVMNQYLYHDWEDSADYEE